ncbi:TonB-dependent receptor [Parerythrobacter aurantius]|uniref:TonB-dependent receptor plug domain-containing protein n=1 Tax=Parerythrobacter aurantius TaxID=3127706 RepID=UPI0032565F13
MAAQRNDPTTITVTGTPIEPEDTGQPVSIIARDEIERVQGEDIVRILQRVPGVTYSRNGGVGSFTGVRVRGAEAEQLLVLVDGVRVNDPSSPAGGFDFGNLLPGTIAQIDLLRSSNSTVWGSDAIGGVLAARTRSDSGIEGGAEYGSRDTFSGNLSGSVESDFGFLSLAGGYYSSDGFSSAASGTESDGFEQYALGARGRVFLSSTTELFANGRYAEGRLEIDGFPFPTFTLSDTDEYQDTTQYSGAVGLLHDNGPLFVQAAYSFADTERANYDPAFGNDPGFTSDGHSDRVEVKGEYRLIGPLLVNFGADGEWTSYETNFSAREDTRIIGGYVQAGIEFAGLSGHVGLRHDDHARFGGATSFGADVSYEVAPQLRLKASVGEGFKAPSLFQLFSDFGNQSLVPEKSTSFDLGLAYRDRNAPFYAAATVFRRDSEDLIQFVSCFGVTGGICTGRPFGTYDNVARARAQGLELEAGAMLGSTLRTRLVYSLIDSEDRQTGKALARRPRHSVNLALDWDSAAGSGAMFRPVLGADVRLVSDSFDNAANTVTLDGYALVDLRAELPVAQRDGDRPLVLFARVENLFDEGYQTAAGYGQAGRGVFGGVRFGF